MRKNHLKQNCRVEVDVGILWDLRGHSASGSCREWATNKRTDASSNVAWTVAKSMSWHEASEASDAVSNREREDFIMITVGVRAAEKVTATADSHVLFICPHPRV